MSEVAHQLQEDYKRLKQEFQEYENRLPPTDTKYGPKGDWTQGSMAEVKELLAINKEQIRVVNCILDERNRQAEENPDGHEDGHQKAIEHWGKTLGALRGTRHLIRQIRNWKRAEGATEEDTEEDSESEDSDDGLGCLAQFNLNTRDNPATPQRDAAKDAANGSSPGYGYKPIGRN